MSNGTGTVGNPERGCRVRITVELTQGEAVGLAVMLTDAALAQFEQFSRPGERARMFGTINLAAAQLMAKALMDGADEAGRLDRTAQSKGEA